VDEEVAGARARLPRPFRLYGIAVTAVTGSRTMPVAEEAWFARHSSLNSMNSMSDMSVPARPSEEFVQLFSRNQRRIYLHIMGQVGSAEDAEEILQETNVVIWSKFDRFEAGTNFIAWSFQIANFEVLKYRDRRRASKLVFSDDLLQTIALESEETQDDLDLRRSALRDCLGKLRPHDRELIQSRYAPGHSGKDVADTLGRPSNSVYQSIGRIRRSLFECISRRLAAEAPR